MAPSILDHPLGPWPPAALLQRHLLPIAGRGFWVQLISLGWAGGWGPRPALPLCAGLSHMRGPSFLLGQTENPGSSYMGSVSLPGSTACCPWAALPCLEAQPAARSGWAGALGPRETNPPERGLTGALLTAAPRASTGHLSTEPHTGPDRQLLWLCP